MSENTRRVLTHRISETGKWTKYRLFGAVVALAGNSLSFEEFRKSFNEPRKLTDKSFLLGFMKKYVDSYGLIVITDTKVSAVTDHTRTFPIYYANGENEFVISNSAEKVRDLADLKDINSEGVQEYLLSGYVHGDRTLFELLHVMPAGRYLEFDVEPSKLTIETYFQYFPTGSQNSKLETLIEEFDFLLDEIFAGLSERLRNTPIFVPLSGGLDSRLILCKLIQHGCERITAFTYGSRHGHEMKEAKAVSSKLGVHWISIPSQSKNLRRLYQSTTRKEYARYADGLHMTPVLLDFEAVYRLSEEGMFPKGSTIINGYSGDFLFGGHIPETLALSPSVSGLVEKLTDKNCSNFKSLKIVDAKKRIQTDLIARMSNAIGLDESVENYCSLYEWWDWSERQCKAVINGQRLYEFFDLDWCLPFWDKRLLEFWSTVPLHFRLNQVLHLRYLQNYNYRNAFTHLRSTPGWSRWWRWVPSVGSSLELIGRPDSKTNFYEYMFYHSDFNYQLALFGRAEYNKWYKDIRIPRVVPLASMSRLGELGIPYKEYLL